MAPIVLKGVRHEVRHGCLVRVQDATGRVGWGDCAPLPGLSEETLGEAAGQLEQVSRWLEELETDPDWADPTHEVHSEIAGLELLPSVRFAVELALFDLTAQAAGRSLVELLRPDAAPVIPVNALLTLDEVGHYLEEAVGRLDRGFSTFKVKVGHQSVDRDVDAVRSLRTRLGPDVAIRCDANQAWSFSEAVAFAEGVLGLQIDYVEEPLADVEQLAELWLETRLPLALDESIASLSPFDLETKAYVTALVLKPTVLGGMLRTLQFSAHARRIGIRSVISAAFESGVAMRAHVALAAVTGGEPAGLDPYNRLDEDVLRPRLPLNQPQVDVPALFRAEHEVVIGSG